MRVRVSLRWGGIRLCADSTEAEGCHPRVLTGDQSGLTPGATRGEGFVLVPLSPHMGHAQLVLQKAFGVERVVAAWQVAARQRRQVARLQEGLFAWTQTQAQTPSDALARVPLRETSLGGLLAPGAL